MEYILIFISAIFVNNIVLSQFLGICPFLPNSPYQCTTELHPISEVANLEKKVPLSWMNANHTQMTDEFLAYARPLIQAELTPL